MKIIAYILSGFAVFLVGLSVYLTVREKEEKKEKINASTAKAREGKALKQIERLIESREESATMDVQEISNLITKNGTTEKENVDN